MMDNRMQTYIQQTLETELAGLSTTSHQRDRLYRNAMAGADLNSRHTAFLRPMSRVALVVALLLAMTCAAGAAFYPRIIAWFAREYGQEWGAWMENGGVALPDTSVEVNGALFTIDEVLVQDRGLYVLGSIRAEPGHMLVEQECSVHEPFGYNIHYGETAPEGTPTIAEKAAAEGCAVHYVGCDLEGIGIDGGDVLQPACWGYAAKAQKDGSIVFSMEVEADAAVRPGETYTLVLCARSWGVLEYGSIDPHDPAEKTWAFTVTPEWMEQPALTDDAGTEKEGADAVASFTTAAGGEPILSVPEAYLQTGTLPVYQAVKRDFVAAVTPEWFNTSGIRDRTARTSRNNEQSVCVVFQDDAQLVWDATSICYTMYSGTVELPQSIVTRPKPTMATAACNLASWMTFGWPETGEVYPLEHRALTQLSLVEAMQKAEALFARLGMEGYTCETALDMSLARIQEMGAKWNALIEAGHILNSPVLDYSEATAADEGYWLRYNRYGSQSDAGGMFHADVYVTVSGVAYLNVCDMYVRGDIDFTPAELVDWHTVAEALPAELAAARSPMALDSIDSIRLTWSPAPADNAQDGMVMTPVWVICFQAGGAEQGGGLYAVFDAIDGRLIGGNWM